MAERVDDRAGDGKGDEARGGPELSEELTAAPSPGGAPYASGPAPPKSISGTSIGHFEVLELLGQGGFGEVYRARDVRLGRMVALKVLPEAFGQDAERRVRFRREAMAASALNHPNICTVYELIEAADKNVLVMELIEGETLHERLAKGPLPAGDALSIGIQVVDALAEAHRAGILHRDVKSGNIMLTARGQVKVLDFGLAKRLGPASGASVAEVLTREGTALGTLSFMSPEQLLGNTVDHRSDLFSFGVVLYEMVTGRLPFEGSTSVAVADAILHGEPRNFGDRPVPEGLKRIVRKLLRKDPGERFAAAEEVRDALRALEASLAPARPPGLSRSVRILLAAGAVAVLTLGAWAWHRTRRMRWAREVATPEIARLVAAEDFPGAVALGREARIVLPGDPTIENLLLQATIEVTVESTPPGADVSYRPYRGDPDRWESPGTTPLQKVRVPKNYYVWRISKPGFLPAWQIAPTWTIVQRRPLNLAFRLDPEGSVPKEMVRVPGGKTDLAKPSLDHLPEVTLDDYLIDRHEVTNEEYRKFVDAGGYEKREFWKQPFLRDGRTVSWDEAMARFRDTTGRPGPATWELGSHPKGVEKHPVGGVSWWEAAAYAEWAGKSLPTIYHWNHAAQTEASLLVSPGSNFQGSGPVPVGGEKALSGFGTWDMAGNVKEWCWNESRGRKRFILGGGFGEPTYMFIDPDAQSPWDRRPNYGFRCVKLPAPPPPEAAARAETAVRDFSKERPVSDEVFRAFKGLYAYDRSELNSRVEAVETTDDWTHETVTFNAAYGGERVIAHLYLPRNAAPPFQTIVFFPGSGAIYADKFALSPFADFLPRSGRALMAPIFKSTFDRRDGLKNDVPDQTAFWRDHLVAWSKDLGRSIDYLETRSDIDRGRLAYLGFSWGGAVAPNLLAVEDRFRVAILESGGFTFQRSLPEADAINFVIRVKIPVLMLNGRYDHFFPVESSQAPLFRLLGTPEKDKRHVIYETGHAPPRKELIRDSVDWLDKYLGPLKR